MISDLVYKIIFTGAFIILFTFLLKRFLLLSYDWCFANPTPFIEQLLADGIPTCTAKLLNSSGTDFERRVINGRGVIISTNNVLAKYIFDGPRNFNFIHRFGYEEGLFRLGMHNAGIIWNNDETGSQLRKIFQNFMKEKDIKRACAIAAAVCRLVFSTGGNVDVLDQLRKV